MAKHAVAKSQNVA